MTSFGPFFERPLAVIVEKGKPKYDTLAEQLLAGWGGKNAGVILREPAGLPARAYALAFAGLRPHAATLLRQAHYERIEFLTLDNGYFHAYRDGGYFRITVNAMQSRGLNHAPSVEEFDRWRRHGVHLKLMRQNGDYVLLVLQSEGWYPMVLGMNREDWIRKTLTSLEQSLPGLPIKIRDKPLKGRPGPTTTFAEDLEGAAYVAALSSNCLVEAACVGVKVLPMGEHPTVDIIGGQHSDGNWFLREAMCIHLANNQWHETEIESGKAWSDLSSRPMPHFRELA